MAAGPGILRHWLDFLVAALTIVALWLQVGYLAVFLGAGVLRLALSAKERGAGHPAAAAPCIPESTRPEMRTLLIALVSGAVALGVLWYVSPVLARLAGIMLKVGVVSFGGGYVMIPILQWDLVDHLRWLTLGQFLDGLLLSYVTPGPLIILAAFVGFLVKGVAGALVATAFIFLPPILIIVALTPYYQRVKEAWWMRPLVRGILAALVGMLALVTVQMGLGAITGWKTFLLMTGAAVALTVFDLNLCWSSPPRQFSP